MPRSSRHKSRRSVKQGREYSDTEEDTSSKGKRREEKESGEKRKLVVKDSSGHGHGNGHSSEEYVSSKKGKDRSEKVGSDRWNGSGELFGLESEIREESLQFDDRVLKSKGLLDLKSKISGSRHDGEMKEENLDLFIGKDDSVTGKGESKRRLERDVSEKEKFDKDLSRKDDYKLKDTREKEKGSEREYRSADSKRDLDYMMVDREEQKVKKGYESKDRSFEDEYGKHEQEKEGDRRRRKRTGESDDKERYQEHERDSSDVNVVSRRDRVNDGTDRDERHKDISHRDKHYWPLEEVYGKHESEKERETRRRKRTGESDDKGKYQEGNKDSSDMNVTSRRERSKDGRERDERHKDNSSRDKNREYYDRDGKSRDVDKREGTDGERTQKYDEYSDDRIPRDHVGSKTDSKHVRDELASLNSRQKKSRTDASNFDSSVLYDDQGSRYKDYKEARGSTDKQEYGDMKSRGAKEYLDSTNKSAGVKEETVSDKERPLSSHPDESTAGQSRRRRSPSSTALASRDQYRHSQQSDIKYRDSLPEDRFRSNLNYGKDGNGSGVYDRAHSSRAMDKSVQKVDSSHVGDLSSERHRITDRRVSPVRLADKSMSPSSTERRHLSRIGDRRSFDYEDSGHRSGSYKDPSYHYHDGKRSQDRKVEAPSMDASSQADRDNIHGSSSFIRSSRIPGNSRSFLPHASPLKHDLDNSYTGSAEEDGRGKLNNHPKRAADSSMGRMQGNAWWGAPNWPPPMGNGYLPFPHGPGAGGFHPMMQQFPPQMFGARPPMDHSGVPFHLLDGDRFPGYGRPFGWPNPLDETCPSPMPNWDSNNMIPGEGFTQGRVDWDQNRNLTSSASREPSVDIYKGANSATMESPSDNRRATAEPNDDLSSQSYSGLKNEPFQFENQADKAGNENQIGSRFSSDISPPLKEISGRISNAKLSEEGKKNVDTDDHVRSSCVYLSKIDISAHLTTLDLFDQCVSLLAIKQSTPDARMSRFSLEEENDVEGASTKINTYFSHVPVFAEVGDSLLEKAMLLYRQQRDDTAVKYLSSISIGEHVHQSPEIQGSQPSLGASLRLGVANDQEHASAGPLDEVRASSINDDEDKALIIQPKLEAPSPIRCDKLDVDVSNQPEEPINTVSSTEEVKGELISVLDTQVTENTPGFVADRSNTDMHEETKVDSPSIFTSNGVTKHDTSRSAEEDAGDGTEETNEEQAAVDSTTTGDPTMPSTTNVHLEGCEDTMMTELNEYGSVNLSRIH